MHIFGLLFTFFFPGVLVGMGLMYGYRVREIRKKGGNNNSEQKTSIS